MVRCISLFRAELVKTENVHEEGAEGSGGRVDGWESGSSRQGDRQGKGWKLKSAFIHS